MKIAIIIMLAKNWYWNEGIVKCVGIKTGYEKILFKREKRINKKKSSTGKYFNSLVTVWLQL